MDNYLQDELYHLIQHDVSFFEFLQQGSLDGIWYWDLENPEHEWMSPEFWLLLGYKPEEMKHLAEEWQLIIFPEDLEVAKTNLELHLLNKNHPYDQVVRYRHRLGHTIWVRCRGLAIRDPESGKPIRMLGAHTDLTSLMKAESQVSSLKYQNKALRMQLEACCMKLELSEQKVKALESAHK